MSEIIKFKIGDRVKLNSSSGYYELNKDNTGTIVSNKGDLYSIIWDYLIRETVRDLVELNTKSSKQLHAAWRLQLHRHLIVYPDE